MATDPVYVARIRKLADQFDEYMTDTQRFASATITAEHPVGYFCAEYGVHNSLPLYSGGLGVLAGDHLKSASDLNVSIRWVGRKSFMVRLIPSSYRYIL